MIAVCKNAESYARKLEAKLSTVSALIALVLTAAVALRSYYFDNTIDATHAAVTGIYSLHFSRPSLILTLMIVSFAACL
jgi:hypothetical protein